MMFKQIKDYNYEVSECGLIRNKTTKKLHLEETEVQNI